MTEWLPLKSYQEPVVPFLTARRHALLADEMGVGKTAAAVAACDRLGARRILVLVPGIARVNWIEAFESFSPMDRPAVALLTGKDRPDEVTVCSYDLLVNAKLRAALMAIDWDVLILDEAHYLKSPRAKRTRYVYGRRCDAQEGLASKAARVWRLTGTPAPNHADELWTHLHSAGLYGDRYDRFIREFCTGFESDYGFKITGVKNTDKLKSLLAAFMLRRKKENVMSLPPIKVTSHTLEPGEVDMELFADEDASGHSQQRLHDDIMAVNATLTKAVDGEVKHSDTGKADRVLACAQGMIGSTSRLRRYLGMAMVDPYLAFVKPELESGAIDKLVIFAQHRLVIELLRLGLKEFCPKVLHGATAHRKRNASIRAFQSYANVRVIICQLQAAGTAINLTAACRCDFVEASWVPAENAQAAARIHRLPQERSCHVRFFSTAGGVHQLITEACARKTRDTVLLGL